MTSVPPQRHRLQRNTPDAAHLEAGVPVLRERGYRLHNEARVDGLAQGIERLLCQGDALLVRAPCMSMASECRGEGGIDLIAASKWYYCCTWQIEPSLPESAVGTEPTALQC